MAERRTDNRTQRSDPRYLGPIKTRSMKMCVNSPQKKCLSLSMPLVEYSNKVWVGDTGILSLKTIKRKEWAASNDCTFHDFPVKNLLGKVSTIWCYFPNFWHKGHQNALQRHSNISQYRNCWKYIFKEHTGLQWLERGFRNKSNQCDCAVHSVHLLCTVIVQKWNLKWTPGVGLQWNQIMSQSSNLWSSEQLVTDPMF